MKAYKVVLVDDDPHALKRLGYLLDEFKELQVLAKYTEAREALDAMLLNPPDILFADIEMPCMDGLELLDNLTAEGCHPLVIFITAYDHYAMKAIKKQAFDYLLKPVDIFELRQTMNRLLDKRMCLNVLKRNLPELTEREKQIVSLLAKGKISKEIAEILNLSKNTIDTYRRQLLRKTSAQTTAELVSLYS